MVPLETFRKERIGGVKENKKKFDKKTAKFCQAQERFLNMSSKKPDNTIQEVSERLCNFRFGFSFSSSFRRPLSSLFAATVLNSISRTKNSNTINTCGPAAFNMPHRNTSQREKTREKFFYFAFADAVKAQS